MSNGIVRLTDNCIDGNTLIPLLNGNDVKIRDLVGTKGDYVYSFDPASKKICPGRIEKVWYSGIHECLKITFDNNEYLICTVDHKLYGINGRKKIAKNFKVNDRMLPFYSRYRDYGGSNTKYHMIWQLTGKWVWTHRSVYMWKYGNDMNTKTLCHHKNLNPLDNSPSNILACTKQEHSKYHCNLDEYRERMSVRMKNDNPLFREDIKKLYSEREKISYELGESNMYFINHNDNPMSHQVYRDKMVETRRKNPLGYLGDWNLTDEGRLSLKNHITGDKNPMKRKDVVDKKLNKTAQKCGFENDDLFRDFIKEQMLNGVKKSELSKMLHCDISTISSRMPNHKIINIEYVGNVEVYNMTIQTYHNFAIKSGIFISNCSGHGCWPPRPSSSSSDDTFVNGIPVVRYGDSMQDHCCPPICHGGTHVGQHETYVNGRAIQVKGDPIDCGSVCEECSDDTFAE